MDQLSEIFRHLGKNRVAVNKQEKRLEEARVRWDAIKKTQPQVGAVFLHIPSCLVPIWSAVLLQPSKQSHYRRQHRQFLELFVGEGQCGSHQRESRQPNYAGDPRLQP